jgi:pyroglutamyl-peptidase
MTEKRILLTGFDPFGGEEINPAWEVVSHMEGSYEGVVIHTLQVPTAFDISTEVLLNEISRINPDIVLCVGQAGGRPCLTVERIAINLEDASIPDNKGSQPQDTAIVPGGPDAYFSNLPIKAMVQAMNQSGVPALVSNTAGTFVCNYVMYRLLHFINTQSKAMKGGFIHVPYSPQQVLSRPSMPSMSLSDIQKGLLAAVKACVEIC